MKKFKILFIIIASITTFTSCEVEFSPNDNWKDIPVVYCILDQDEDTTYVRVQRCFMGEGNQLLFAQIGDSINYPQGALTVIMEEWASWKDDAGHYHAMGSKPLRVYNFDYDVTYKDDGIFYSEGQPVYKAFTRGLLDTASIYFLKVIKNATGDTIASSETVLIRGNMRLFDPNNTTKFNFSGAVGNRTCNIKWSNMSEARKYQPVIRFWYYDLIVDYSVTPWDTTITPGYVDIPGNVIKSNMRDLTYSTKLEENKFLATIESALKGSDVKRFIIDTVQVYILCCDEDLSAFIYANNPQGTLSHDPFTYTNIEGGLGIFAARRRNINFKVATPNSPNTDYIKNLKALNVGF